MEAINELHLRRFLKTKPKSKELLSGTVRAIFDASLSWEEKRAYWHYLYLTGHSETLAHTLVHALKEKQRIPFDLVITILREAKVKPSTLAVECVLKGVRKQSAVDELIAADGFDAFDARFQQIRQELVGAKVAEFRKAKDGMLEKFHFLRNQRMNEQAGRVLRRMLELYPEDQEIRKLKTDFDEEWAREVLSNHMAALSRENFDRTLTAPSSADEEMLKCFMADGEKICLQQREFAADLAVAFWFMEDYNRALDILAWAEPTPATEWMRVEVMVAGRRFVEALELLGHLEVKYVNYPESTFAVSYMRAQCLHESGQHAAALEIMQSIVRVRPGYRSAHALILEWSEGVAWE